MALLANNILLLKQLQKTKKKTKTLTIKTIWNTSALVVTKWSYTITSKYIKTALSTGQSKSSSYTYIYIQCKKCYSGFILLAGAK